MFEGRRAGNSAPLCKGVVLGVGPLFYAETVLEQLEVVRGYHSLRVVPVPGSGVVD